jgi:hypothetical protein
MSNEQDHITQIFETQQRYAEDASRSLKRTLKKLLFTLEENPDFLLRPEIVSSLQRRMLLIQQVLNQDELNLQQKIRHKAPSPRTP